MENVLIYSLEWSTILFEKLFLIYYPITWTLIEWANASKAVANKNDIL
jgi:hypothetical protein